MFLSLHRSFSFVIATVACTILERMSKFDPSFEIIGPITLDSLKFLTSDFDVCVDSISIIGHQLGFFSTNFHIISHLLTLKMNTE